MKGTLKRLLIVLIAISMVVMPGTFGLGYAYADETTGEAVSEETADVAAPEDGDAVEGPDLSNLQVPRLGEVEDTDRETEESEPVVSGIITKAELDRMNDAELDQTVRVSIVLSKAPVLDRYSVEKVNSFAARNYRKTLKNQQAAVEKDINKALGKDINVKWHLTLSVNVMSAEVTYRDIKSILEVKDVLSVQRENRYEALTDEGGTAEPNTALTSEHMVGAQAAWADGYTGAGQRVAIIDTGADIDHQSFNSAAFDYAIQKYEAKFGKTVDLMDASDIEAVAGDLNGAGVYLNTKMPYTYNYVDADTDVTHIHDTEGEHGSHVAGIAAANRYIPDGDSFVDTLDGTYAVGMAPDAQLLVMKVFGKNGGAYDSDYIAAIEDSIVLDCDSCNLSLGSASAGFTYDNVYQDSMNKLISSNTVAAISAGNSYPWNATNAPYGMLYGENTIFNTVGSPGSYINAFTVAAAQNVGVTGSPFLFGDEKVYYTETDSTGAAMATLDKSADGTGTEYDFVYIDGKGFKEEYAIVDKLDPSGSKFLRNKMVFVNRGTLSFVEKGNNAKTYKPKGLVVVNNTNGSISMALDDYSGTFPFVSINGEDRETLLGIVESSQQVSFTASYDFDGDNAISDDEKNIPMTTTVYTGKMVVTSKMATEVLNDREDAYITDFSSWGVPESLLLKPEITAPGGGIYSVFGSNLNDKGVIVGGTDKYELMSGTSMAAPHIAGLSAVVKQYLEENDLGEYNSELTDKYTLRAIAQSLMMSTATPMIVDGNYLPVIQQGAGLVEISKAINATSVVMIDNAFLTVPTGAAQDGKVKVELGDDPKKLGEYFYSFTIYNTTNEDEYFELDSDFFTQYLESYPEDGISFLTNDIDDLDVTVNYTWKPTPEVEGQDAHDVDKDGDTDKLDAQAILDYLTGERSEDGLILEAGEMDGDGKLTTYDAHLLLDYAIGDGATNYVLPAGGKAEVYVTLKLNEDLSEYPVGAYIEGFTYANCVNATDEGLSLETSHSIPVLGFYGNWTDSSMFDYTSLVDVLNYGEDNVWPSYSGNYSNYFQLKQGTHQFIFTGNPYVAEEEFPADRLAMTSDTLIKKVSYNLIRNAATTGFAVSKLNEEGKITEVLSATIQNILMYGLYTDTQGTQQNTGSKNCFVGKTPADYGLHEGDLFRAGFYAIPEYNAMLYTAKTHMAGEGHMYFADNGYLGTDEEFAGAIMDEDRPLGEGAYVGYDFVVDDTLPVIKSVNYDENEGTVTIKASDNEHLAIVSLVSLDGSVYYAYEVPEEADAEVVLDISEVVDDIPMYAAVFVGDYAGNEVVQLLKVNDNDPEFEDPTAPEYIEMSSEDLAIYKGNTEEVSAKVIPITATNTNVTWKSTNESVATVSNGTITAVAAGEADIIATSEADSTVTGTCHVKVISVEGELKAIAWDYKIEGNENEYVIKMDVSDAANLKTYEKLGDAKGISTTTAYYGLPAGTNIMQNDPSELYVGTFDYSTGDGEIYKTDANYNFVDTNPETPEIDSIGPVYLPVVDSALGYPATGSARDMAYVYGPYLVLGNSDPSIEIDGADPGSVAVPIDVTTHPNYQSDGTYFCALALKGYDNEYTPEYYVLDDTGMLWDAVGKWGKTNTGEDTLQFELTELFNVGFEPNWLRQSMFYDDELDALYIAYTIAGTSTTLYYVDVEDELVLEMGEFGDEVWPVTGLFNKPTTGLGGPAPVVGSHNFDMEAVKANMAELNAFRDKVLAEGANGSTNSVSVSDRQKTGNLTIVDPVTAEPLVFDDGETHMWVEVDELTTNGFATIKYDPEVLTYVGPRSFVSETEDGPVPISWLTSIHADQENGLITIAYADKNLIESYAIACLEFKAANTCEASEVVTTTIERNDEFDLNEVSTAYLTSHVWGEWEYDEENEAFTRECEKCGATESEQFPVRVKGKTRYATSMEVANKYKELAGIEKFEAIVVATGDAFPDALTGSYVSIEYGAPMLLINKQEKVMNEILDYIYENAEDGAEVFLLGGKGAVDESFETALKNKGYDVTRLSGKGRYDTNLAILDEVGVGSELLVCSGLDWPDAATSSATGLPILIVGKELNAEQKAFLEANDFEDIYVVGGKAAVSEEMFTALKPYAKNVTRVAGKNRAATAIAVAEEFYSEGISTLVFAYQNNFPDCISGGLLAYELGAPILYGPSYLDINTEFVEQCGSMNAYALGGKSLVTTEFFLEAYADMLLWRFGYEQ